MIVVVSPQARDDISEAYRHFAANNLEAADHFLARVAEIIGMLAAGGVEGRFVQLGDGRTVQTRPIPPYRRYYRKTADSFQVLRFYHQARRPIEG
jgi:plasmid stabilization system protein ParE